MADVEVVAMLRSDLRLRAARWFGYGALAGLLAWPAAVAVLWLAGQVKVSW